MASQNVKLAMQTIAKEADEHYALVQSKMAEVAYQMDGRYTAKGRGFEHEEPVWVSHQINKVKPQLLSELRTLDAARFKAEDYSTFSVAARDIMARRFAIRNDPDIMLTWMADGLDDAAVGRMLGFTSTALLRNWLRKSDKTLGTNLMEALAQGRESLAVGMYERAETLLESIGEAVTRDGRTLSAVQLAADFNEAALDGDEEGKFRIQQMLPIVAEALKHDTAKKQALAKHFTAKAAIYSPLFRPVKVTADDGGNRIGNVNIGINLGNPEVEVAKEVNESKSVRMVPGITIDME